MKGRDRRLQYEYDTLTERFGNRRDVRVQVLSRNESGIPVSYDVNYLIRSICSVGNVELLGTPGVENPPVFADSFTMRIEIPYDYPCVDAQPSYRFLPPYPWHPNIRWFGSFAGRVCLNTPDTYTDIAWCVERVAQYLRYEKYHALNEAPYPEDQQVAAWVIRQGEPKGWVYFNG